MSDPLVRRRQARAALSAVGPARSERPSHESIASKIDRIEQALFGDRYPTSPIAFGVMVRAHLECVRSPVTRADMRSRLKRALARWEGRAAHEITHEDVAALRLELIKSGLSGRSVNLELEYLALVLQSGVDLGHALANPARGFKPLPERKRQFAWIPPKDQRKIVSSMPTQIVRDSVAFMLGTGLCISEFIGLCVSDVRLEGREPEVLVNSEVSGREGKRVRRRRIVPIPRWVLPAARRLRAEALSDGRARFSHYKSGKGGFYRLFKAGARTAGLDHIVSRGFHDLRHLYTSTALRQGIAAADVARLIGTTLQVVQNVYGDHAPGNYRELARKRLDRPCQ